MNVESLIEFVKNSSVPDDVKQVLVDRLEAEGLTTEVADALKQAFQDRIDEAFDAAGVKLDPTDPEFVEKHQAYADEVENAQKEFEAESAQVEKEVADKMRGIDEQIDEAHADKLRADLP